MLRTLILRSKLKKYYKHMMPIALTTNQDYSIVFIRKLNLLTVEVDYLDVDAHTLLASGTMFISDIQSVGDISVDSVKLRLLRQNPDLIIDDGWGEDDSVDCPVEDED
jgi:hypothetical protein